MGRYIFNVGEGFQRFCVEHKIRLAKVNAVLLTRTSSLAAGGLPGAVQPSTLASKHADNHKVGSNDSLAQAIHVFAHTLICILLAHWTAQLYL